MSSGEILVIAWTEVSTRPRKPSKRCVSSSMTSWMSWNTVYPWAIVSWDHGASSCPSHFTPRSATLSGSTSTVPIGETGRIISLPPLGFFSSFSLPLMYVPFFWTEFCLIFQTFAQPDESPNGAVLSELRAFPPERRRHRHDEVPVDALEQESHRALPRGGTI